MKTKATIYDLMLFGKTGIQNKPLSGYEMMYAKAKFGGGGFPVATLTGVDSIDFLSDGTPLISWTVIGNEQQTGTPTPSAPIQPEECGDRTAQLFDISTASDEYYINDENGLRSKGSYNTSASDYIYIAGMSNITIYPTQKCKWGAFYDSSKTFVSGFNGYGTKTVPNTAVYVRLTIYNPDIDSFMVNEGQTALPHEPFGYAIPLSCGGTTQPIYLSEQLRKIGDYADTISSDGTVTRQINKLVLTGEETGWAAASTGTKRYYRLSVGSIGTAITSHAVCTHFQRTLIDSTTTTVGVDVIASQSSGDDYIAIRPGNVGTDYTDVAAFKAYIAEQYANGTPICVWYVLATAQTETFTAPTITPAKGANTLSVGTTLPPSEVSITGKIKAS